MFVHFGAYSQLQGWYTRPDGSRCKADEWIKRKCAIPDAEYDKVVASFNPSAFDARKLVSTAKAAGQKYIVFTAKHHEGFAMWPTKVNDYNIHDRTAFKRDILAELAGEARRQGIRLGFYYSIWDWHDPDARPGGNFPAYVARMKAQIKELLTNYGDVAELWFDGEWDDPSNPWTARDGADLEQYVRELSPATMVNNRIGKRRPSDGDFGTPEQEIPDRPVAGQLWESCMTITPHSWGYADWDQVNLKTPRELVHNLVDITSRRGNYLLNVGPDRTGTIPRGQVNTLAGVGQWLRRNPGTVYGAGSAGQVSQPGWGAVTQHDRELSVAVYDWPPADSPLRLEAAPSLTITRATLSDGRRVAFRRVASGYEFTLPARAPDDLASVIEVETAPVRPAPVGTGTGLSVQYWNNPSFTGAPSITGVEPVVNHNWHFGGSPDPAIPSGAYASRWTGLIEPRYTETYTLETVSSQTVRLWLGGSLLIDNTGPHAPGVDTTAVTLIAGQRYAIRLEQTKSTDAGVAKLLWSSPNTPQQVVPATQLYPAGDATAATYNDDAPQITYTGSWGTSGGRGLGDFRDDVHYTTTDGDAFEFAFTGAGVDLYTERNDDQGVVDIYLDGTLAASLDTTTEGGRLSQSLVFQYRWPANGTHTLRGVKRNGQYLLVDRLDVR